MCRVMDCERWTLQRQNGGNQINGCNYNRLINRDKGLVTQDLLTGPQGGDRI